MLNDTKRDLIYCARKLTKPYENYSIDELADAYCDAVDTNNESLKDIYINAELSPKYHAAPVNCTPANGATFSL